MKVQHWITAIILLLLVAVAIAGVVWTRELPTVSEEAAATPGKKPLGRMPLVAQHPLIDQRPLQTAKRMAALAATPEEQLLAHQAEKVGDHEVDLSFLDALRTAEENPPQLSPEARQLADRKNKAELALKEDQEGITLLTRKLAASADAQKDNLQDQIDVAKAQMDLDQNELDDASEDLEQAGGDPQSKIKRLQGEHESGEHAGDAALGSASNPHEQDYQSHTLLSVFRAWRALREKKDKLRAAQEESKAKQLRLSQRHQTLTAQVEKDKENREAARQQAKGFAKSNNPASRDESKAAAKSALDSLKQYTRDQKISPTWASACRTNRNSPKPTTTGSNWSRLASGLPCTICSSVFSGFCWFF